MAEEREESLCMRLHEIVTEGWGFRFGLLPTRSTWAGPPSSAVHCQELPPQ